ncbi:hypothetical protein [Rhizobium halophytocola]|uniref:Succinoglycan biosynthesis protein exoi n=1 Tax=Rhizobium halophytocola TaxID=735519 RepID=A0ABS4DYZ7_9HYPH|nr:hypothetical protein [Rhizobium halophytocola]MBP1850907.1 hypothetical protein [Rhizobium halophytocola]
MKTLLVFATLAYTLVLTNTDHPGSTARAMLDPGCNIKGNIAVQSGRHIYHTPGQEDYDRTIIRTEYGERWFCSESEARTAGWEKASR